MHTYSPFSLAILFVVCLKASEAFNCKELRGGTCRRFGFPGVSPCYSNESWKKHADDCSTLDGCCVPTDHLNDDKGYKCVELKGVCRRFLFPGVSPCSEVETWRKGAQDCGTLDGCCVPKENSSDIKGRRCKDYAGGVCKRFIFPGVSPCSSNEDWKKGAKDCGSVEGCCIPEK